MERQLERCAGLDVHRDTVAACVRVPGRGGHREQHVQTFGTTAAELLRLREWLEAQGVTDVAMESTGVYWKPIYYVLEEAFTCLLVNAAPPSRLNQAAAPEQIPRRAGGRPCHIGAPLVQPRQQFAGSPARMLSPRRHDRRRRPSVHAMGAAMRRAAPLEESGRAAHVISIEPFVAGPSTDAVARTQLRHRVEVPFRVRHQAHPFLHRLRLRPGHVHLPVNTLCGVTYVPGLYPRMRSPRPLTASVRPANTIVDGLAAHERRSS